jgi:hypothetical protein
MTGTTTKSIPASKHDEKELQRLQKKDYWLQIARAKLLMDLIFVCGLHSVPGSQARKFDRFGPQHMTFSD